MLPGTGRTLPLLVAVCAVAGAMYGLQAQGRPWWCSCGYLLVWSRDPWSPDTSQHLFGPYGFTHVLHGFVFFGLFAWVAAPIPASCRLPLAVALEGAWEIVENSDLVIRRYREGTAALGYEGNTVVNSLGDMAVCGLGFALAYRPGAWRTLALFVATEMMLAARIRDSLLLNVLMLAYPIDAVKTWQMGL